MTKEQKMIEMVEQDLHTCVKSASAVCYTYGSIPQRCLSGAMSKYLNTNYDETILGLIDTTVMGGGERGAAFTTKGFYIKEMFDSPKFYPYENWYEIDTSRDDVYFDFWGISMLMINLSNVEEDKSTGVLETVVNGALNIFSEVIDEVNNNINNETVEMAEKMGALFRKYSELLSDVQNMNVDISDDDSIYSYFLEVLHLAALAGDESKVREVFNEDEIEDRLRLRESLQIGFETYDQIIDNPPPTLKQSSKRFSNKIFNIMDELSEHMQRIFSAMGAAEDFQGEAFYYEKCQSSITQYRKALKKAINAIDEYVDEYYDIDDD